MKRHPALRALSSDHHQGLVQARRLVKAAGTASPPDDLTATVDTTATLAPAAGAFLTFWSEHTTRHFREEEEVLLPAFARYGDPSAEPVVRVLVDHTKLRMLVSELQQQLESGRPSPDTMSTIGEMLRAHIRHEENVLFPLIEITMPDEALAELHGRVAAYHNSG
jgi:hemerythrin-like domain-containing protein